MTASDQFTRIVSLVADLTRRQRNGEEAPTILELAGQFGVAERDITADIRTLTLLGDHAETDWLLSLRIWQQGDRVLISSAGPFRRPVRLSPEEMLAVQVALAMDPAGADLAARLAAHWSGSSVREPAASSGPTPAETIRNAIRDRIALEIEYAGESDADVRTRVIHPFQLAESGIRTYIVAWAPDVGAWRHFRLDRIVSVRVTDERFSIRYDFDPIRAPTDTFRPGGGIDRVRVRFRPEVAPWVTEFFAEHELLADGSVDVQFPASSTRWLTRRVLEFGADAEVVEPARYREAVQRAIA